MVADASQLHVPADLEDGHAALGAALAHLRETLTAYRRAGRADLAATLCQALRAGHQAEVLRAIRPSPLTDRDPADWFRD